MFIHFHGRNCEVSLPRSHACFRMSSSLQTQLFQIFGLQKDDDFIAVMINLLKKQIMI